MKRLRLVVAAVLATVECGGGGGGGTGPTPGSITVSAGNNQVGAAGAALAESLAVLVRDQGGAPLGGVNVTFAVTAGSVSPGTRATGADGIAKTRRTLGPNAGTQTTSATAGSLAPAQFSAVSQINGAVNIANGTSGPLTDTVTAIKAESLTVLVTDQTATPVQGISVSWASTGGSVSSASVPTNASGLSKVRFTYGTLAGNQTATATVTGLQGSPVTVTLNATAGTAVGIAKTAGDNGTAPPGTNVGYTAQSRDTHGNAKGGVTLDWAADSGGGSINPTQNTTQANGNASATRTLGSGVGVQTATVTAAGLPGTPTLTFRTNAVVVTTVDVANNSFTPGTITITVGDSVTWEWQGTTLAHNVTFSGAGAPLPIANRTSGFEGRRFNTAGSFSYACTNHPPGMIGTVNVNP